MDQYGYYYITESYFFVTSSVQNDKKEMCYSPVATKIEHLVLHCVISHHSGSDLHSPLVLVFD